MTSPQSPNETPEENLPEDNIEDNIEEEMPPEYQQRSLLSRLLPAIVMMAAVMIFVLCHFVAHSRVELLSGQFLIGSPLFLGAWVAYFSSYKQPVGLKKITKIIFVVMCIVIFISIPILKEGFICVIMASPILFSSMFFGALLMHAFCQKIWKSKALHAVVVLPIAILFLPITDKPTTYQHTQSTVIHATPAQIWTSINHVENINEQQFYQTSKLLPFMGVPAPKSAITVVEQGKLVRKCQWHGNIYFDEPIISQVPNQTLKWQFNFYEDSVPKGTLDDHVTLNGEHFKLLLGEYDITAIDETHSQLTFKVTYRITTNINFYAGIWGKWVMKEFSQDVLGLYKQRLETKKI